MPPSIEESIGVPLEPRISNNKHYEPLKKFQKDDQHHVEDLRTTPNSKAQVLVLIPSLTYVVYMNRALKNILLTLIFDWTMPLFSPFNFLLLITLFPTLIVAVVALEFALHIGFKFGLDSVIQRIGDKWGEGLSPVNWWDPRIFTSEVDEIVKDGIKSLDAPLPLLLPEEELDDSIFEGAMEHRGFNLDMAELLLFMSSIIYERNNELVKDAHKVLNKLSKGKKPRDNSEEDQLINSVTTLLKQSETRIHEQARRWGIKFTSLSELNSLGGPFSGMFWSEEHDFIVVVFKGTNPSNFEDFVIDLMFQRVDARSFVFGEVHEGFYTALFPQEGTAARASRASPYITMIRAIRAKAADIRAVHPSDRPINVWITGHSLGAALASLFYARLLKSTNDLGPNCILRDGYMFGSPSVGDADFAAEFASYANTPYDRQSTLWRIIDDKDIITKIPPGWNDPTIRRLVNRNSILNYAHIGEGIRFFQSGAEPAPTKNLFSSGKTPVIIDLGPENNNNFGKGEGKKYMLRKDVFHGREKFEQLTGSPLVMIENLLPTFFRDHLPARYFSVLQKARRYFDDDIVVEEDNNLVKIPSKKN
ncbi:18019_t:CDS:2 [Funneliformis geosporum]|uniref:10912_t:CDS:1 n=1 Tax=Funneliformis geosporum TaxID=1117311 RepID=A0A9W4WWV6_9GLOM|nr:10912_t:CDS:2 [Funneliformis geosporum]CAI2185191.1 18019_t:CDS:2 [Funneliformis geosporum]